MYKILRQKKLCKEEIVGWFESGFFFIFSKWLLLGREGWKDVIDLSQWNNEN